MLFKKRTSILRPWAEREISERARDYYSFTLRGASFPKSGQQAALLEESLVGAAVSFCCVDAFKRLKDKDFNEIAANEEAWSMVSENCERVTRTLLNLFEEDGYRVGDKEDVVRSTKESFRNALLSAAEAAGWRPTLTTEEQEAALDVIRHLQTQSALQQLTMEIYNDGLSAAATGGSPGDEFTIRGEPTFDDLHRVKTLVLPTAVRKVALVESMVAEHEAFQIAGAPGPAREAYDRQSKFLTVFLARARLQLTCFQDYVANPTLALSERLTSLDEVENESMTAAIVQLNRLIEIAGLTRDAWLGITWGVFNDVRSRVGLKALTETDFRARSLQGMSGGRARFFE